MKTTHGVLFLTTLAVALTAGAGSRARSQDVPPASAPGADALADRRDRAIASGIAALASAQSPNGRIGEGYPVAITSMAGLAILAAVDDPLHDPTLLRAHAWLRSQQKEGNWPQEGSTWVHVQGFATLFFAELYGKVLAAPDAKAIPAQLSRTSCGPR